MSRQVKTGAGQAQGLWQILLLLLVAVVVPTVCVLWFMTEAIRNERLAVRQKLTAVYHDQLVALEKRLRGSWEDKQAALESVDSGVPPAQVFAELVRSGVADSVIVYDASGRPEYPATPELQTVDAAADSAEWLEARRLEFEAFDYPAAAASYSKIAEGTSDANLAARALQARARCLSKAGEKETAVEVLTETLDQARFESAVDPDLCFTP